MAALDGNHLIFADGVDGDEAAPEMLLCMPLAALGEIQDATTSRLWLIAEPGAVRLPRSRRYGAPATNRWSG